MKFPPKLWLLIAGWLAITAEMAVAASATVHVGQSGLTYTPSSTNINQGDSVIWTWDGFNHSTTSNTGLWDSGVFNSPHLYTNTFNSAGTFAYHCSFHGLAMSGTVIVTAPNQRPVITLTNPLAGAILAAPANITMRATATDSDGSVANVQFLVGTSSLATVTTPPYAATTNNLAAGTYNLAAIATDNLGAKTTNNLSITVVTPVTPVLSLASLTGGQFRFSYGVNTGLVYFVQSSTNLLNSNWTLLASNPAASNPVVFVDTATTNPATYYRVGRYPNP